MQVFYYLVIFIKKNNFFLGSIQPQYYTYFNNVFKNNIFKVQNDAFFVNPGYITGDIYFRMHPIVTHFINLYFFNKKISSYSLFELSPFFIQNYSLFFSGEYAEAIEKKVRIFMV